ncbi:SDR family oxidoreductase [Mycolicibacterium sp. 018/SC-01/001]|uniref:SDR family NAD(P)-dependent oxidoreductase n=1 Tax=Mycolicibacterium sp. 018/SC-01/001 TaxID=2592069 RepID=UPI00117F5FC0|nr:SDR family oxidoreductase [Mycolicibacterium sp. 018/SC-01/001]TRW82056.1 SDR family oxidoreductase [Mycolicibacterium sp. 018/SC-01/001]
MPIDHLSANLNGKVAIVTGAASGVGLAITRQLHEYGVSVVAEDVNPDVLRVFADTDRVAPLVGDVSTEQAAVDAVSLAGHEFGTLDILINNAGVIVNKPIVDTTLDDWNRILGTNVTGAFLHTREAMRAMAPRRSGAIVNIGSYACFQSFETISAYAASKGALAQLTRTAALEGIGDGIRVNAIGSGDVVTNILGNPDELAEHGKGAPIKRAADPTEIAYTAAFLASDLASFAVGAVWMLDGGMSVAIPNG